MRRFTSLPKHSGAMSRAEGHPMYAKRKLFSILGCIVWVICFLAVSSRVLGQDGEGGEPDNSPDVDPAWITPEPPEPERIWSLAWSPDGSKIAMGVGAEPCNSIGNYYGVDIVDAATHNRVITLGYQQYHCPVNALAWSPDGTSVVASGWGEPAVIWNARSGKASIARPMKTPNGFITHLWSSKGDRIASIEHNSPYVQVWDTATGETITTFDADFPSSMTWSPDETQIATAQDGIRFWNATTGAFERQLTTDAANVIAWSPDGSKIAGSDDNNHVVVWNVATGSVSHVFQGHSQYIYDIRWRPDSQAVASASADGTVRVWDVATGGQLEQFTNAEPVYAVDWSPDGSQLVYGGSGAVPVFVSVPGVPMPATPTLTEAEDNNLEGGEYPQMEAPITPVREPEFIWSLAWSPDGNRIALAVGPEECGNPLNDYSIHIIDAKTKALIRKLDVDHTCPANAIAWSPDSTRLVVSRPFQGAIVYNMNTGLAEAVFGRTSPGGFFDHEWNSSGTRIFSIQDSTAEVSVWSPVGDSQEIIEIDTHNFPNSIALSPDSSKLASAADELDVWDANKGSLLQRLTDFTMRQITWSPDGSKIAGADTSNRVIMVDASSGNTVQQFSGHSNLITQIVWRPDSQALAISSADGTVRMWDVATGAQLEQFTSAEPVYAVAWSPDGSQLVYGGGGATPVFVSVPGVPTPTSTPQTTAPDDIETVAWSPDGNWIAVGGGPAQCNPDNLNAFAIRVFDANTSRLVKNLLGNTCIITALDWSPDSSHLLSASLDSYGVRVWDIGTGKVIVTDQLGSGQGITFARLSPDGTKWVSSDFTSAIVISDTKTGAPLNSVSLGGGAVDWSPDGGRLASGFENKVQIADVSTGGLLREMMGHTGDITSLDWSPVGDYIATGSRDETVKVWNAAEGQLITSIDTGDWASVCWSPDGKKLAIAYSGTIQIWDVHHHLLIASYTGLGNISAPDWSPDGTRIAFYNNDTSWLQKLILPEDALTPAPSSTP
jgi:WD40 repeat protein